MLALLHGFTQTRQSFGPVAERLAASREVRAIDLPGHGESSDVRVDLWGAARFVVGMVGKADYLGYSMGGRIALHAALVEPASVQSLILVGVTAGIADPLARAERRAADEALADELERDGVARFLEQWLAQPMFSGLPREAGIEERLVNTAPGLASALRLLGTGTQEPLDDRLGELTMPVLLVVGERDPKFCAEAERLQRGIPHAAIAEMKGAGHPCHLERPDTFCDLVDDWLTATPPDQRPSPSRGAAGTGRSTRGYG